jgi:hypothetical protein
MSTIPVPPQKSVTEVIERWLAVQLSGAFDMGSPYTLASLQTHTVPERVLALYDVLGRRPDLARRTASLPVVDQLRLSLELLRVGQQECVLPSLAVAPASIAMRCRARRRGRSRAR